MAYHYINNVIVIVAQVWLVMELFYCSRSELLIESVQLFHAGIYTCVAELPGASASSERELIVQIDNSGPIRWQENPKVVRARVGDALSVDCTPTSEFPSFN